MEKLISRKFILLVLTVFVSSAAGNTMKMVWETWNCSDKTANDYHLILEVASTTNRSVTKGPFESFEIVEQPDDVWVAKWSDGEVPGGADPDDEIKLGLGFSGIEKIKVTDAFWTVNGCRIVEEIEEVPGFKKVESNSVTYIITNDMTFPMTISGLQFLLNEPTEYSLAEMGYGAIHGSWSSAAANFTLNPGEEKSFYQASAMDGMWQLVQFEVLPSAGPCSIYVMQEFNVELIPEPATLLLLGLGGYGLLRRRKRA
jgi:hypothetical protein